MYKSLVAISAAVIAAATLFTSTAEAGFKFHLGFGGPFHGFNNYGYQQPHRRVYVVRRAAKKVEVAKKVTHAPVEVAKIEEPKVAEVPVTDAAVESENSSITTAAIDPSLAASPVGSATTAAVEPAKVDAAAEKPAASTADSQQKTASKVDCKKFFPSAGLTLTVPCE